MSHRLYTGSMSVNTPDAPLTRGEIWGFRRISFVQNVATWTGGLARCESDTRNLRTAANIVIDNTVVGANGRSSTATAPAAGVAYYIFAIVDVAGNVAGLCDTSLVPTLPSGYIDYVLIDIGVCQAGSSWWQNEISRGGGRVIFKQFPWGTYTVTATDAQTSLSLPIPAGTGGNRVVGAVVGLSNTVAVANQSARTRTSVSGTNWFTMWAGQIGRVETRMPVTADTIVLDAVDSVGTTFAGQMILMALEFERGGSL